jgi:hypothetical protein
MRNTRNDAVRVNTGFELLKMAGYGAVQKAEVNHTIQMDKKDSARIANTLDELSELRGIDVTPHIEVGGVLPSASERNLQGESSAVAPSDSQEVSPEPEQERKIA